MTIQNIWDNSNSYKHPIISFMWVLTHPLKSLRLIQFAIKVMITYKIRLGD